MYLKQKQNFDSIPLLMHLELLWQWHVPPFGHVHKASKKKKKKGICYLAITATAFREREEGVWGLAVGRFWWGPQMV